MECCHGPNRDPSDNRLCNLRWGTHTENMREKTEHGTQNTGSRHGMAKLTEERVVEIRQIYGEGKTTQDQLAEKFGVSAACINTVVNRRRWLHV